jgi:membrane associated rhomboid family serine protease
MAGVRRWTAVSLLIWLLASFGVPFFAARSTSPSAAALQLLVGAQGACWSTGAGGAVRLGHAPHGPAHDLDDED